MLRILLGIAVLLFVISGVISFVALNKLRTATLPVVEEEMPATVYESVMTAAFHKAISNILFSIVPGIDGAESGKRLKTAQKSFDYYKSRLASYAKLKRNETNQKSFEVLLAAEGALESSFTETIEAANVRGERKEAEVKMFDVFEHKLRPAAAKVEDALDELTGLHVFALKETQTQTAEIAKSATMEINIAFVTGTIILCLFGFLIIRRTFRILSSLATRLESAFGEMASSSNELRDASEKLYTGSTEATESIQLASDSLFEMDKMIERTIANIRSSGTISEGSRKSASSGSQAVAAVINGIGRISESSLRLADLQDIFVAMKTRIEAIDRIVFKTQILRFNAAIEAARAGKYGHGFYVVAEQISELSEMSLHSSQEIRELINQSTIRVESIVKEIRERVDEGQDKAKILTESFTSVMQNIKHVNESLTYISQASEEQAIGISKINKSTGSLKNIVSENSAVSGNVAHTSLRLNEQSARFSAELENLYVAIGSGESVKKSA